MKKYFVIADIHGYYDLMIKALKDKGFDIHNPDHIIISLGDVFDRGQQPLEVLVFLMTLYSQQRAILIRGNHEDLLQEIFRKERFDSYDLSNGTIDTIADLAKISKNLVFFDFDSALNRLYDCKILLEYLSVLKDYAEINDKIFTHGWIPINYQYNVNKEDWNKARWKNGMLEWSEGNKIDGKTIYCGHWHTSWGHAFLEKKSPEFGEEADFSPFIAEGIVAVDGCTAYSKVVNVIVFKEE